MKKLNISQVRKNLPFKIQVGVLDILDLKTGHYGDVVDFDVFLPSKGKNLQRGFVWTLSQKQELILSILKGIEVPPVSIIQFRDDTVQPNIRIIKIIDGKQRISAVMSFFDNQFPIIVDGEEYFFNDLDSESQYVFNSLMFRCQRVYEYPDQMISDDDKISWFEMINFAGTPQDIEHLNNLKS